ncbi:MAG: hypothetical protein ACLQU3_10770 [Limisphaerales bacterium]
MKKGICTTLVATQLMGVWLAVAQTNSDCGTEQQQLAIQANTSPVAVVSAISAKPLIAVSPSRLDFGRVAVGATNCLTFTVQNAGSGTLSGFAVTSPPFGTSNSFYSLGSFQRQMVAVRYMPTVKGTNLQSVTLKVKGGGSATVSVSGCGVTPLAPPTGLRVVATGP